MNAWADWSGEEFTSEMAVPSSNRVPVWAASSPGRWFAPVGPVRYRSIDFGTVMVIVLAAALTLPVIVLVCG